MSSKRSLRRCARSTIAARAASILLVISGTAVYGNGCLSRPICDKDCRPKTTNVILDSLKQHRVDKIDLLFMIDNSVSMADKQELLRKAVPDLVGRLVNPVCIDKETGGAIPDQPSASERCPAGSRRQFDPVNDVHVGILSSSLGASVSATCSTTEDGNDLGHLIGARPRAFEAGVNLASAPEGTPGFLAWEPGTRFDDFTTAFTNLVTAVDDEGCGYEASLESWYRFLVDPDPPLRYQKVPCETGGDCAAPFGRDEPLLAQRAAFLRPDSLLAIIMLSDENDCSMRPDGQSYWAAEADPLPRAATICEQDPNDPCCYSCGMQPPPGCIADPICATDGKLTRPEDPANLRCFNQKRRFGYDFLYPTARYVRALRSLRICPTRDDLDPDNCAPNEIVDNPIYTNPDGPSRSQELVFLAGIIGVPWQDIRADVTPDGKPIPDSELRFKTAEQMSETGSWDVVLGDSGASPPQTRADPLMIESLVPRAGTNPVTNDPVAPPSAGPLQNPINGHEWNASTAADLQYACIFPLREGQRLCASEATDCDCSGQQFDPLTAQNPLCQDPGTGAYGTTQYFAKAYPGIRHLQVLKDFGDNSIVASICARKVGVDQEGDLDFGYRPAIAAIVDSLQTALGGPCLPRELAVVREGGELKVPCRIVEAIPKPGVACNQEARKPADPELVPPSLDRLEALGECGMDGRPRCDASAWSFCEITQSTADADGNGIADCLEDVEQTSAGWCYVDPQKGLGDQALVDQCPATEQRTLRFVAPTDPIPAPNATLLIACLGAEL